MKEKGKKGKRKAGIRRTARFSLAASPARRFLPALPAAVILLVACVSQRFSVVQIHQENVELRAELEKRIGEREREEAVVAALLARGRIESVARERLALRPPEPGEQVFLAEWTRTGRGGEGWFDGAGRGWTALLGMVRGGEVSGGGTGRGR